VLERFWGVREAAFCLERLCQGLWRVSVFLAWIQAEGTLTFVVGWPCL